MKNCSCGGNPIFFDNTGLTEENIMVKVKGIRCPRCFKELYVLKDINESFTKDFKEALEHSWNKMVDKDIISNEKIKDYASKRGMI